MKKCEIPGCKNDAYSKASYRCSNHKELSLHDYHRLQTYKDQLSNQKGISNLRIEKFDHKTGCPFDLVFDVEGVEENVLLSWTHGCHKPDQEVLNRKRIDVKKIVWDIKDEITMKFGSHSPSDIVSLYVDFKYIKPKKIKLLTEERIRIRIVELKNYLSCHLILLLLYYHICLSLIESE